MNGRMASIPMAALALGIVAASTLARAQQTDPMKSTAPMAATGSDAMASDAMGSDPTKKPTARHAAHADAMHGGAMGKQPIASDDTSQ